ncbi:MAG: hypothetical protein ACFUZC_23045 [Chthoniobacteraceae bacterium]
MNQIILSVCAFALAVIPAFGGTAVCVSDDYWPDPGVCLPKLKTEGCTDQYRAPYMITYPRMCYFNKTYPSNTEIALEMRRRAIYRQREMLAFENEMREASAWNVNPAAQGQTLAGSTEGAGAVNSPCMAVPPAPPYPGPAGAPPIVAGPPEVPTAAKIPGRPGYVFCPFGPNYGCFNIKGLRSGSLVQDPFTRRVFRIP